MMIFVLILTNSIYVKFSHLRGLSTQFKVNGQATLPEDLIQLKLNQIQLLQKKDLKTILMINGSTILNSDFQ